MHHFDYKKGVLHAEGVAITDLAAEVGTPFYCYSTATLERHFRVFQEAMDLPDTLICYAVKANSNLAVIRTLAKMGAGADVVSEGELRRSLAAGIPANRIVFSGVGKTEREMAFALDQDIYQFNVESEAELELLALVSRAKGKRAPVAIRVNPDVDAGTHAKISTGKAENKFGISHTQIAEIYERARQLPGIDVAGLAMHIGSQVTDLKPFEIAVRQIREQVKLLRGHGHIIDRLDLGGGLGIPYDHKAEAPPLPKDYGKMILDIVRDLDVRLMFEPGRMIVGNAGILVSRVVYLKTGNARRFVVLDAAMNDLIRPALYDAWHDIIPVKEPEKDAVTEPADIVGPVCESTDTFAKERMLPPLRQGSLVAFLSAGAYGAVQASTYNTRPLVPEILVNGDKAAVVRPRPSYDELLSLDTLPPWLEKV